LLTHHAAEKTKKESLMLSLECGAGEEARTLDLYLGKVSLYQLSYSRIGASHKTVKLDSGETGAGEEARTLDLYLGKVSLYQLSYSRIARREL
jgi:hypothetical protein